MNRYRQIKQLGSGAYGVAVLAEEKRTNHSYVIKVMQLSKLPPESQECARKEVAVLAGLHHRNIVRYYESFEENNCLHIVMEYCDGGDLEEKIKARNNLSEKQIWDYFVQICLALKYLHKNKILHRDIKPANIFLTRNGEVKLGDFGVSRTLANTFEMASTFAGTPVYLPPEMCDGQLYDDKCDMWSLGVILYEMVTGKLPFLAVSIVQLAMVIMNQPHKPIPPSFSTDMRNVIDALLQKNPIFRPSAEALLQRPFLKTIGRRFLSERELHDEFNRERDSSNMADRQRPALVLGGMGLPGEPMFAGRREPRYTPRAAPQERRFSPVQPFPLRVPEFSPVDDYSPVDSLALHKGRLNQHKGNVPVYNAGGYQAAPPLPPKPEKYRVVGEPTPKKELTLYEELLELGDCFDVENIDFNEAKWFNDEAAKANGSETEANDGVGSHTKTLTNSGGNGSTPFLDSMTELENYLNDFKESTARRISPTPNVDTLAESPTGSEGEELFDWELRDTTSLVPTSGRPTRLSVSETSSDEESWEDTQTDTIVGKMAYKDGKFGEPLGGNLAQNTIIQSRENPYDTDPDNGVAEPPLVKGLKALDLIGLKQQEIIPSDDEDGDNTMHHLFAPLSAEDKNKDLTLYDELLAQAFHEREMKLAGLTPKQ